LKVLVVDDSAYQRLMLASALRMVPGVTSVDTAPSGEAALRSLVADRYDLMTLDLEMPGLDGFAVLRWVMENRPLPVLVVTSLSRDRVALSALELGAYDVLRKPAPSVAAKAGWKRDLARSVDEARLLALPALANRARKGDELPPAVREVAPARDRVASPFPSALVVAASTGGPAALRELFSSFPRRDIVVGVAQHLPAPFTRTLAARLASLTGWSAREAADGEPALPGTILVAPAGNHMEFVGDPGFPTVRVCRVRREDRWVPSANTLLSSAAALFGKEAVAVVLTGMGNDGSEGASRVAEAGGTVIAESAETAVIPGMPDAASRAVPGALRLPLGAIGRELERWFPLATLSRFHE
jgi:two-component system chemotaxis response regulator CheB